MTGILPLMPKNIWHTKDQTSPSFSRALRHSVHAPAAGRAVNTAIQHNRQSNKNPRLAPGVFGSLKSANSASFFIAASEAMPLAALVASR
jgi:hypothetical protein